MDYAMNPAEILDIRVSLGMTQKQLAERVGVDRSAVAQWECGNTKPRGPARILLAQLREQAAVTGGKKFEPSTVDTRRRQR